MRQVLAVGALLAGLSGGAALAQAPSEADVLKIYADIALSNYQDSYLTAAALYTKVVWFLQEPTEDNLAAARDAWKAARIPYQQTEVFRFGNPQVDAWEGKVNAWPLDEGLIDYVAASYGTESEENALYTANVIANPKIMIDGAEVDASAITPAFLQDVLQEAGGNEANVATGYHAVEFLLWGQDLNGTGPGAGARPATDFDVKNCTNGNCDRRRAYLEAATLLLREDIVEMTEAWAEGGSAREELKTLGISAILTGMGSLSFGEVAGERMKLGLLLHDPEEEHDCFSDNTHISHLYDAVGVQNAYLGRYLGLYGDVVIGPSVSNLVAAKDADLDFEIRRLLDDTIAKMNAMKERAETVEAYDQMIAEGNTEGNAVVQAAIDALIAQTRGIERAVALLGVTDKVTIEQSDSLTNPDAVFQ